MTARFEPPAHYDDERREIWTEAVARLTAGGRVFRANPEILDTYVEAVRSHRQASRLLAKTNVLLAKDGKVAENPALAVQRRSAEAMTRASKALGLDRIPAGPIAEPFSGDPIAGSAPDQRRWCEEHQRRECRHSRQDGKPCHQWRLVGGLDVCRKHGGKSLGQLRADGQARAVEREAAKLLYQYDAPPVANPLDALQRLAGRVAAAEQVIGEKVNDLTSWRYEGEGSGEQLRAEIGMLERSMGHLGKLLVDIARLNIDERLVKIEEQKAKVIVEAIEIALATAGIKGQAATEAKRAAARHLRAVAA